MCIRWSPPRFLSDVSSFLLSILIIIMITYAVNQYRGKSSSNEQEFLSV